MITEKIEKAKPFYRFFQLLVILLANKRCGIDITPDFKPQGIFKFEGGATVCGREIVITYNDWKEDISCYDNWNTKKGARQAEVTEEVVRYLLSEFCWVNEDTIAKDVTQKVLPEILLDVNDFDNIVKFFTEKAYLAGDPLRSLFQDY